MKEIVFYNILEMSLEAGCIILAVLALRVCLKEKPKVFSYVLWIAVFFRLLCPVSLELPVSFVPQAVSSGKLMNELTDDYVGKTHFYWNDTEEFDAALEQGADLIVSVEDEEEAFRAYVVTGEDGISKPDTVYNTWLSWLGNIWIAGIVGLLGYSMVHYYQLKKNLVGAVPCEESEDVYFSDYITTAFVIGSFYPKIYLPSALSEKEKKYILMHEKKHIQRKDPFIKSAAFMALCIHWFHPLVWLAFFEMTKDMEKSCDEAVLNKLGEGIKREYAASLFRLATGKRIVAALPLAFGEGDTKERIANVMKWKRAATKTVVFTAILCLAAGTVSLANVKSDELDHPYDWTSTVTAEDIDHCMAVSWKNDTMEFSVTEEQIADFVYVLNRLSKYDIAKGGVKSEKEISVLFLDGQKEILLTYGEGITTISFDRETSLGLEQKVWQTRDALLARAMKNLIAQGTAKSSISEVTIPTEENVQEMRQKVLEGMSQQEVERLTELVKVKNQKMEYEYLNGNRFAHFQDAESPYWNVFTQSGTILLGWGISCTAPEFDPDGEMTEEEYCEIYGTPFVAEIDVPMAEQFYAFINELRSLVQNDLLKADFDDLEECMRLATETHDVNYLYRIYYKLHDLDYFLLRYGPKDVGKYTMDDSTVCKYYGILSVYERQCENK